MATPVISWSKVKADSTIEDATRFDIGIVDAGSVSDATTFLIWNNKGGASDVSNMTNCTITTKDSTGGNTGDVVTGTWIQVKVDSANETTFSPIGGTVTKAIKAAGAIDGVIEGKLNDGTVANSALNFAKVTLQASIPQTATAGNFDFITRVSYQYV